MVKVLEVIESRTPHAFLNHTIKTYKQENASCFVILRTQRYFIMLIWTYLQELAQDRTRAG